MQYRELVTAIGGLKGKCKSCYCMDPGKRWELHKDEKWNLQERSKADLKKQVKYLRKVNLKSLGKNAFGFGSYSVISVLLLGHMIWDYTWCYLGDQQEFWELSLGRPYANKVPVT